MAESKVNKSKAIVKSIKKTAHKKKNLGGRPTKMTDDTIQKLEQALQNGFSIIKACELSGIVPQTYYNAIEKDGGFLDKMTRAQNWTLERARQVVTTAVAQGDPQMSRWYLERKASDEFGNKTKIDATIKAENPFEQLTPEERLKLDDDMRKALEAGL